MKLSFEYEYIAAGLTVASAVGCLIYDIFLNKKFHLSFKECFINKDESFHRSNDIHVYQYTLLLYLNRNFVRNKSKLFHGSVIVEFKLANNKEDLFLEFGGKVNKIIINDVMVNNYYIRQNRIYLKKKSLAIGYNKIILSFENNFSEDFLEIDPNNEFIYLKNQVYRTHNIFPCFDQPNMKANLKLFVLGKIEQNVYSVEREISSLIEKEDINAKLKAEFSVSYDYPDEFCLREFKNTNPISTDGFNIIIGDFFAVDEENCENKGRFNSKIKILVRKSVQDKIDNDKVTLIFKYSNEIINFYDNLFSTENLPFNHLTYFFLPTSKCLDFSSKIVFLESFILKNDVTNPIDVDYFLSVIAHHLSHMWIKNCVSIEWWDDQYLFESICSYLAHLCLDKLNKKTIWNFFNFYKLKAFRQEVSGLSHQVEQEILNSQMANFVYDEILAYKYSSIIQYFGYLCGETEFLNGLKLFVNSFYFKTANANNFKDFFRHIKNNTIAPFKILENFVYHEGFSTLEIIKKYKFKVIENLEISQISTTKNLFYHKFDILLIYENRTEIYNIEVFPNEKTQIPILVSKEVPKAFVLNYNDTAYFRQIFDENSVQFLIENADLIYDVGLTRLVVARDLCEMVQEGLINPLHYLNFTTKIFKSSKSNDVSTAYQILSYAIHICLNYILLENQSNPRNILANLISELIFIYPSIKDLLINKLLDIIDTSRTEQTELIVRSMENVITSFKSTNLSERIINLELISSKTKLRLLETLFESNLITNERKLFVKTKFLEKYTDNSSLPIYYELILDACLPNKERKQGYWETIIYKDKEMPLEKYESIMRGFSRKNQFTILKTYYKKKFFEDFEFVLAYHGIDYAILFFNYINPYFQLDEKTIKKYDWLNENLTNDCNILKNMINSKIALIKHNYKTVKKFTI